MTRACLGRCRYLAPAAALLWLGCAAGPRAALQPPPAVDLAAQRQAYDRGVSSFGRERYAEARQAWREAVRDGPLTPVGLKARRQLEKVDQVLRTLSEIDDEASR